MRDNKEEKNKKDNPWTKAFEDRKKRFQEQKELSRKNSFQARNAKGNTQRNFTRNRRSTQGGGSTVEILVAFVIITLALTSVIMVVFGNQSFALDTKVTQRALYHAERGIETAFASSTVDFSSLASAIIPLFGTADDIYGDEVELTVTPISECVKEVESSIGWGYQEGNRDRASSIASIFVSTTTSAALGHQCRTNAFSDDWDNPTSGGSLELSGYTATDLKVYNNIAYIGAAPSAANKPNIFIVDVSDENNPTLEFDAPLIKSKKVFALDYILDGYLFVASSEEDGQLQILDVSNPSLPSLVATSSLPGVGSSYPEGRVIEYYDEQVFMGTWETAGDELHVFDVSVLSSPNHIGSKQINHSIQDIKVIEQNISGVTKKVLYVALSTTSSSAKELWALDVTNPTSGIPILGEFQADGVKYATSIKVSPPYLYLGLRQGSASDTDPNFYILDVSDPGAISSLGSSTLDMGSNSEIVGMEFVGSGRMVIATTDSSKEVKVINIDKDFNIDFVSTCAEYNYPQTPTALSSDVKNDRNLYLTNDAQADIRVIRDSDDQCGG